MRSMTRIAMLALWVAATAAAAQQGSDQLDFLAGNWRLHDLSGALVGSSRIVVQAPALMLYEERRVGDGDVQPLWFENSERNGGRTQLFTGASGMIREFPRLSPAGTWPIVMGADVRLRDGTPVRFRLTMSRASNDETRRVLERSSDQGATWSTVFDLTYRRSA